MTRGIILSKKNLKRQKSQKGEMTPAAGTYTKRIIKCAICVQMKSATKYDTTRTNG